MFWLVFHEDIKVHHINGRAVALAPLWLLCIILGMVALVYAPRVERSRAPPKRAGIAKNGDDEKEEGGAQRRDGDEHEVAPLVAEEAAGPGPGNAQSFSRMAGLAISITGGLFSSLQYGVVTRGQHAEQAAQNCTGSLIECPVWLQEEFNGYGSWMTSFGIGAATGSLGWLTVLHVREYCRGRRQRLHPHGRGNPAEGGQSRPTAFHFEVMKGPGTAAGLCSSVGNFFSTLAVQHGGNAIVMPMLGSGELCTTERCRTLTLRCGFWRRRGQLPS